jgi:hypothetical protein
MKAFFMVLVFATLVLAGGSWWSHSLRARDTSIVTESGLHWHAMLSIMVGTTTVTVPARIGLSGIEMPIHTHDDSGRIHMEFPGVVRPADMELRHVFEEWGHSMGSFGANMTMTVNGATSTAYGDYVMHDGDRIVLHYD